MNGPNEDNTCQAIDPFLYLVSLYPISSNVSVMIDSSWPHRWLLEF